MYTGGMQTPSRANTPGVVYFAKPSNDVLVAIKQLKFGERISWLIISDFSNITFSKLCNQTKGTNGTDDQGVAYFIKQ